MSDLQQRLLDSIGQIEVVDCHEHVPPEHYRLESVVDVFTLFSHYTRADLLRAGMRQEELESLFNRDIPLPIRWKTFSPYWERIRYTSYSKAALLAAERFYEISDINEHTYEQLSEAINAANKPVIYERVLRKTCNIETCLTVCGTTDLGTQLLTPVMPLIYEMETAEALVHPLFEPDATIKTLDDYLEALGRYILRVKSEGAVGLKMFSCSYDPPDRSEAISLFGKVISGSLSLPHIEWPDIHTNHLRDYVVDWAVKFAGEQDLVVAVHAGYWGDFRQLDPLHMIPMLTRHPDVRFDIYHLGYPWVRETLMLGKGFSNVWLNFCWTHIISQRFALHALDEAIDLLPMNKILGFGGDYNMAVEKIYGHLVMARQNISEVLARRIESGQMSEDDALQMARMWLNENPKQLYRLPH